MNTAKTIGRIFGAIACAALGLGAGIFVVWGWHGVVGLTALAVVAAAVAFVVIRPWMLHWGATGAEVGRRMRGDERLDGSTTGSTRAVTVHAPPGEVWAWVVQIGFGRGGWYSYDWIDNDGRPSAEAIDPRLQHLDVGDTILMTRDQGFTVRSIDAGSSIVSQAPDATTWILELHPVEAGAATRLISRFRVPPPRGLAGRVWGAIAGPGSFVMERKMLLGIKRRAEARTGAISAAPVPS